MRRHLSLLVAGLATLTVAACGQHQGTAAAPLAMSGAAPIDAALVTPQFGWVLTPDALLLTHDGGTTFAPATVPLTGGDARAAYFRDANTGLLVEAEGTTLVVARTADGGATWRTTLARDPAASPAGYSELSVAFGDANDGAILARTATSQAFSVGTLFATADGGASWSAHPAPEAGQLSVDPGGRTWLAGSALHVTSDQGRTWSQPQVQATDAGAGATLSTPVAGTLPVTVSTDGATSVELYTTPDHGATWTRPARVALHARTGAGVRVPVAASASGLLVFDTVGGHAYRPGGTDVHPSGLPEGVVAATFATDGQAGWALAAYGTCASGKGGCVLHHELVSTSDGGTGWHPLAAWAEPVD